MGKLPSHLKLFIYVSKDRSLYVVLAVLQFTMQTKLGWLSSNSDLPASASWVLEFKGR